MKQKDIYYANLDPVKGSEQRGQRPVVILSGNTMNTNMNLCIICPITSKIKNIKTRVLLQMDKINNLNYDSEIIVLQVRTISKQRLNQKIGEISNLQLNETIEKLNDILKF